MSFVGEAAHAAAVLKEEHRLPRQHHQYLRLFEGDAVARCKIEDAHSPERQASGRYDKGAGIEVDIRLVDDERVIRKARIRAQIRDDKHAWFVDGMAANRKLDWNFATEADIGFAPLTIGREKIEEGDGGTANDRSDPDQIVESRLGRSSDDVIQFQGRNPLSLGPADSPSLW